MSLEPIMNVNGTLDHNVGSVVTGGTFAIISTPSMKVSADGGKVYRGPLLYSFTGGSAPGFTDGSVSTFPSGVQTLEPTAQKCNADGMAVVREGDEATGLGIGVIPSGGIGSVPVLTIVSDAGQSKVSAQ